MNKLTRHFTLKNFLYIISILTVAAILYKPPVDPDFGWHYKYGEYIVTHGQLLKDNIFSYTMTDYKWVDSYWVSQIIFYLLYNNLGMVLAGSLLSIVFAMILFSAIKKASPNISTQVITYLLIAVGIAGYAITVRPVYFSTIFMIVLLHTLLNKRKLPRWIPLMFLVWANTHADFTLGIFVLGTYTLFSLVELGVKRNFGVKKWVSTAALPLASLLATLVNPYGLGLWIRLFEEISSYTFSYIQEFMPLNIFHMELFWILYILFFLILISTLVVHKKLPLWFLACLFFFAASSLNAAYFMRVVLIFGVFLFPLVFDHFHKTTYARYLTLEHVSQKATHFWVVLIVALVLLTSLYSYIKNAEWYFQQIYPEKAAAFIRNYNPETRIFNYYGWGGYLIWQVPEYKPFIDGRMANWRSPTENAFDDYLRISGTPYSISRQYLEKYDIGLVLYKKGAAFPKRLKATGEWVEIYSDEVAVVLEKVAKSK